MSETCRQYVERMVKTRAMMIFGKSNDPHSQHVKQILDKYFVPNEFDAWVDLDKRQDCQPIEHYLRTRCSNDQPKIPYIFFAGLYFGSLNELLEAHTHGKLYDRLFSLVRPTSSVEHPSVPSESTVNERSPPEQTSNESTQPPRKIIFRFLPSEKTG